MVRGLREKCITTLGWLCLYLTDWAYDQRVMDKIGPTFLFLSFPDSSGASPLLAPHSKEKAL